MQHRARKRALVVRGGWEGHCPVEATERFIPYLRDEGFDVAVHEDMEVYADSHGRTRKPMP